MNYPERICGTCRECIPVACDYCVCDSELYAYADGLYDLTGDFPMSVTYGAVRAAVEWAADNLHDMQADTCEHWMG